MQVQAKASVMSAQEVYDNEKPPTPILDTVNFPIHLKNLTTKVCLNSI
jgi:hypothetical protein